MAELFTSLGIILFSMLIVIVPMVLALELPYVINLLILIVGLLYTYFNFGGLNSQTPLYLFPFCGFSLGLILKMKLDWDWRNKGFGM